MFLVCSVRVWLSDSARDKNFDTTMRERADQLVRDAGDLRHANRSLLALATGRGAISITCKCSDHYPLGTVMFGNQVYFNE